MNLLEHLHIVHNNSINIITCVCSYFTISFFVSVPVLSLSKYSMRPSSSGMVLFLTRFPRILASRCIIQLYMSFPMSRLTRKLHVIENSVYIIILLWIASQINSKLSCNRGMACIISFENETPGTNDMYSV